MPAASKLSRVLFQSDFDGTITVDDVSFLILDKYARGDWRKILKEYKSERITVGQFNTRAFRLVREELATIKKYVLQNYNLRPGFSRLVNFCRNNGFRFVIVSNGLDFYIKAILQDIGMEEIEVYSARTTFGNEHIEAEYIGPGGDVINDAFKQTFSRHFIDQGYRVIYAGNGVSDAPAASLAQHAFATDSLTGKLEETGVPFTSFQTLDEIVAGLQEIYGA